MRNGLPFMGKFNSTMMGMPFEGLSIMGYNNISSGATMMTGLYDEATKTLHLKGKQTDRLTGGDSGIREEMKVIDDNTYTMSMYGTGFDGKEMNFWRVFLNEKNNQSSLFKSPGRHRSGLYLFCMKQLLASIAFVGCMGATLAQPINPQYDSVLAKQLGADDYGMKQYFLVLLKTVPNKTKDKKFIDSCFAGHFANMGKLEAAGQLIVAGPFGKNDQQMRGLFILRAAGLAEAQKLAQTDPAVNGRLLRADVYPWYGSAALPEYLKTVDKIWKKQPG